MVDGAELGVVVFLIGWESLVAKDWRCRKLLMVRIPALFEEKELH